MPKENPVFNFNNSPQTELLKKVISDLLEEMDGMDSTADNYGSTVDNLVKLVKLQNETFKTENDLQTEDHKLNLDTDKMLSEKDKIRLEDEKLDFEKNKFEFEKEKNRSWRPSPDAIIAASASILGIVAIIHYEKVGIITSKALSFVGKMK